MKDFHESLREFYLDFNRMSRETYELAGMQAPAWTHEPDDRDYGDEQP